MPKLSKAVIDAKKAIDTHDDITFVVHMKGPIFLDEQGYLSGYIKDVRNILHRHLIGRKQYGTEYLEHLILGSLRTYGPLKATASLYQK